MVRAGYVGLERHSAVGLSLGPATPGGRRGGRRRRRATAPHDPRTGPTRCDVKVKVAGTMCAMTSQATPEAHSDPYDRRAYYYLPTANVESRYHLSPRCEGLGWYRDWGVVGDDGVGELVIRTVPARADVLAGGRNFCATCALTQATADLLLVVAPQGPWVSVSFSPHSPLGRPEGSTETSAQATNRLLATIAQRCGMECVTAGTGGAVVYGSVPVEVLGFLGRHFAVSLPPIDIVADDALVRAAWSAARPATGATWQAAAATRT